MKTLLKALLTTLLSLSLTGPGAFAQERPAFTQPELDQMLAPVALYPDPLLSQILMAATYPLEVVQAARWSRANARLNGEDAVRAVEPMDWDPSVKSLVAFPQILDRMDQQVGWTERLGEAFIAQEPQVMDTIQDLRRRADAAGNLGPSQETRIVREGGHILIEPYSPQIVYVPYYDPYVVYGPWWWPAYRPVYWAPWPGHHARRGYASTYLWGSGITIRIGFFFGHFDWPHRHVTVVHHQPPRLVVHEDRRSSRRPTVAPDPKPVRWQHDPRHRRSAPFRHVGPRASTTARPAPSRRDDQHPSGSGSSTRPQSQRTPQPPARAVPAAPRSDTRPAGAALNGQGRQARRPAPIRAAATRSAGDRGNNRKPAASAHENAPVVHPLAAKNGGVAPRAAARPAGAAHMRRDQQAQGPGPAPASASYSAGERRNAQRPAATVRKDEPVARPLASPRSSALRVADGQPRAETPRRDLAAHRSASAPGESKTIFESPRRQDR